MKSSITDRVPPRVDQPKVVVSSRHRATQPELLPLTVLVILPKEVETADATSFVIASDGLEYLVKTDKSQSGGRAAEWVTHGLAQSVNINTPEARIIKMPDGQLAFGSRIIQKVDDEITTANLLLGSTIPGMSTAISRIIALDWFVANIDRHDQNYRSQPHAAGHSLFAIDHTRALFWHGEHDVELPPGSATVVWGRRLVGRHGLDVAAALQILDAIDALQANWPEMIFRTMPEEWLNSERRKQFSEWWSNGGRSSRVAKLRQGLSDGSLP